MAYGVRLRSPKWHTARHVEALCSRLDSTSSSEAELEDLAKLSVKALKALRE